jgi:hypothetical protein
MIEPDRKRIRLRRRPPARGMGGLGDVSALVISTPAGMPAGEIYREGMAGMGSVGSALARITSTLTSGATDNIQSQLARVELALRVSTVAAVGGALLSLWAATRRR